MNSVSLIKINEPNLRDFNRILIFPHVMPDGDAIGSCVAMYYALKSMGKEVYIVLDDDIPAEIQFIAGDLINSMEEIKAKNFECELCISIDCSDIARLGERRVLVNSPLWNIDHHVTNDLFGEYHRVVGGASSACEVLYDYFVAEGINISIPIAEALYVGISTDTGSFKYSSTKSSTHRAAAHLLDIGIDLQKITINLYQSKLKPKMLLEKLAVDNMSAYADGKMLITYADAKTVEELGADFSMTDGIIEILRDVEGVELAVYIKELSAAELKVSLRSKQYVDVSEFAHSHGGGGHKRAAGFSILDSNLSIDEVIANLANELELKYFS